MSNYENNGAIVNALIFSNANSIQYSTDSGTTWEKWFDLAWVGTTWTTVEDGKTLSHHAGYDSTYTAYYIENGLASDSTQYDRYYFVNGLGLVKEIDTWGVSPSPYTQTRSDWDDPTDSTTGSPVPEPTTMLLFGAGLISLAAVTRKKGR